MKRFCNNDVLLEVMIDSDVLKRFGEVGDGITARGVIETSMRLYADDEEFRKMICQKSTEHLINPDEKYLDFLKSVSRSKGKS